MKISNKQRSTLNNVDASSKQNSKRTQEAVRLLFVQQVKKHREKLRILSEDANTTLEEVLPDSTIEFLSSSAAEKMWLTLSDGGFHSIGFTIQPVFYDVSTFPVHQADDALNWFRQQFGGYTNYLTKAINDPMVKGKTLCHITFGLNNKGSWVQIGVFPTTKEAAPAQFAIMPTDLFTEDEKRTLGSVNW